MKKLVSPEFSRAHSQAYEAQLQCQTSSCRDLAHFLEHQNLVWYIRMFLQRLNLFSFDSRRKHSLPLEHDQVSLTNEKSPTALYYQMTPLAFVDDLMSSAK